MNYLSPNNFSIANDVNEFWSNAIILKNQPPVLQCSYCHNNCNANRFEFWLGKILLIELFPNSMSARKLEKKISCSLTKRSSVFSIIKKHKLSFFLVLPLINTNTFGIILMILNIKWNYLAQLEICTELTWLFFCVFL